jgi:hypothetical protein
MTDRPFHDGAAADDRILPTNEVLILNKLPAPFN